MFIDIKKYPELKLAHLFVVKFPKAAIAGGVARDLLNKKKFKDVDIFIPASGIKTLATTAIEIYKFCQKNNIEIEVTEEYFGLNNIVRMKAGNIDICILDELSIDIDELLNKFDMVASQAWLEVQEDNFIAKASNLFHLLNDRKVLGLYSSRCSGRNYHIESINQN